MGRHPKLAGLVAAGVLFCAAESSAVPIDPIVRVRDGGSGSIRIFELPFVFDFGVFPGNPDPENCRVDGTVRSCLFQNLTSETISLLDFSFNYGEDPTGLIFDIQDPDNLFAQEEIDTFNARFAGDGVASGACSGQGEIVVCDGGLFWIDLVDFPDFANITMIASQVSQVPEPAGLFLLGVGVAAVAVTMRERRLR